MRSAVFGLVVIAAVACTDAAGQSPAVSSTGDRSLPDPTTTVYTRPSTVSAAGASTSTLPAATLDLVVVGDSFVGWSEWPELYASLAADEPTITD